VQEFPLTEQPESTQTPNPHFLGLQPELIGKWSESCGHQRYRGDQIAKWIYQFGVCDPDAMSNLPKDLRATMQTGLDWDCGTVLSTQHSEDNATKLLLRTHLGNIIETVILRYEKRTSLCVSSQVGCKLRCTFCQTGKMGFHANLLSEEILLQVFVANRFLETENRKVSHVVFMGMGEPLDNYDNVKSAIAGMTSKHGFSLSPKRITLSTSGIIPALNRFTEEIPVHLAISLHSADEKNRTELMPLNKKYSLEKLKEVLLKYQKKTGNKITLEYILIKDVNSSIADAKKLVRFIHGLRVKVNLIPFNQHPGLPFDRPDDAVMEDFQKYLSDRSIPAPIRYSKGLDVSAACGQLVTEAAHGTK
jgi:23S rRNA (adenine2503-C2)-methyltransferase